ncbi:hypothetical protein POKO110462_14855 [Pontibacter korlensis]|uniref:Uncharacterized protein n=1 Tax=Pontibacter korlensis TaxID=400092 RepID=A0A0E3ZIG3_9BACT|nr:hypothetical protein [Pontibacter korlensis]AKD05383.1 hypothetical protein PKOR_22975 [Pontibacter korlensis]
MRTIIKFISLVGLLLTVLPALLVFTGTMEQSHHKMLTLAGTALWFLTAPFWMNRSKQEDEHPAS